MDLYGQDSETVDGEQDLFKPEYKKYKRKDIKLDLGDVIDFTKQNNMDNVSFLHLCIAMSHSVSIFYDVNM